jgi:GMP synthase-like glutamine amidotransferase
MSNRLTDRRKSVLIVQHAPHEHPAAVRRALESQGIQTLWLHPYQGEELPSIDQIAGMISLGGPMSANDEEEHSWIRKECRLLRESVEAGLPTVGICLGAQMMARALGGKVERHDKYELGWFPIQLNETGKSDPILGIAGDAPMVYHWHGDTFYLPPNAQLLAGSKACPRQAYRVNERVYGFQFHPEADHQLVHEWLAIEGVEEEILDTQKLHGARTVQDAQTQRNRASKGEKSSIRITVGLTSLFRRREREPLRHELREQVSRWATRRRNVILSFEGSDRKITHLQGRITGILNLPAGDFLILQEQGGVLWPLRTDDILSVELQK